MQTLKGGKKKRYQVRNWSTYNQALVKRGSIDLWLDPGSLNAWKAEPSGRPGAPRTYADAAIQCALTVRSIFRLPLRGTEGFLASLSRLLKIECSVPDFTTLSRRGKELPVLLAKTKKEKTIIAIDSTGAKVYGEGEWKVRQHGASKRRTWKKIHIAIDENGEIRAAEATGNDAHDSEVAKTLLAQEDATITTFAGDGGYDRRRVYDALRERNVLDVLVPPQKNAKIWQHGNCKAPPHARDENLRHVRRTGRKAWKEQVGYHVRSLIESTMFRFKTIFGDRLQSRGPDQQDAEIHLKCRILNQMFHLGMPDTIAIA